MFKQFQQFENWLTFNGFVVNVIGILGNLFLAPMYYWGHRDQYDGFCNFRERVRKFGLVGRLTARVLDSSNNMIPTFWETFWFFIWAIFYVGFYLVLVFVLVLVGYNSVN